MKRTAATMAILALLLTRAGAVHAASDASAGKAFTKLTRGLTNIVTGWVEVPKRVQETSEAYGTASGWTWGMLRGLGYGFIRTVAGCYEVVTFPFPAPPAYEPVIQPAYVFNVDEPVPSRPKP